MPTPDAAHAEDNSLFGTDPLADGLARVSVVCACSWLYFHQGHVPSDLCAAQELPNGAQLSRTDPARLRAIEQLQFPKQAGNNRAVEHDCPQPIFLGRYDVSDFAQKDVMVILWNFVEQLPDMRHLILQTMQRDRETGRVQPVSPGVWSHDHHPAVSQEVSVPMLSQERTTLDAKHPVVMRRLPDCVRDMLPVVFTHSGH